MRRLALALSAACCVGTVAGCTNVAPDVAQQAIVGGTDDSGDPAVEMWIAQVPGSQVATVCTATLISPHVLLTAAHCVEPDLVGAGAMFTFFQGQNVDRARSTDFLPIKETHYNPDFKIDDVTKGSDIAVGILDAALSVAPIPMNTKSIDDSFLEQPARLIGYGKSDGADTAGTTAGMKRQVTTQLVTYDAHLMRFGSNGQTTCEGDSGGPALMMVDGVESIVGVVSFGDVNCQSFGVDTRVDAYLDSFIRQYVDAADPGMLPPEKHGCSMGGRASPNRLVVALALVGLALFAARRRLSS